ncbi:MAG TPA: Nramp family divalent metal transporter [Candidatus Acidoferrum sp.]|jgi:NRAMP (natural resistance-associated macrophage protein)-like metal ion transporter|nr:Nramp family divalent metal transporter [Candidatus Acidoferrum sp.]
MNWETLKSSLEGLQTRGTNLQQKIRGLRRRLTLLLAVVGPGLITSNVDNDAGGIATYSQAGAQYGYALLWSLIPMTIALYVTEEMCARMGVITGKGLSDLIREEFGFRPTFFVMVTGFFVDLANVVAEFAGVAASMEMFHVSRYIAVPIAAILVWILVLRGTYRQVEVIFLIACGFYVTYIISAILAKPDWLEAAKHVVIPNLHFESGYLLTLTALVGTTIAPWQFFYLQAGFVEKKVGPRQYPQARADVLVGSISCMVIVFFIIVATAATLYVSGQRDITDAVQAAKALIPLAGKWAGFTFAFGLLNASLFAATILPLSTAHVICEGLGFEAGIDHKFKDAKIFYGLYTVLIAVGAGIILIPHVPIWKIFIFSQVGNGVWLPIVIIFILLLVNRRDLMGEHVNTVTFNIVAWVTAIAMIILTLVLVYTSLFQAGPPPAG